MVGSQARTRIAIPNVRPPGRKQEEARTRIAIPNVRPPGRITNDDPIHGIQRPADSSRREVSGIGMRVFRLWSRTFRKKAASIF
jgi:hypothetical protein